MPTDRIKTIYLIFLLHDHIFIYSLFRLFFWLLSFSSYGKLYVICLSLYCLKLGICSEWAQIQSARWSNPIVQSAAYPRLACGDHPFGQHSIAFLIGYHNFNWLWKWGASRVNLWYFFVERNIWKDDSNYEEDEEDSDITDSEQEEKKVRSRRLPVRR